MASDNAGAGTNGSSHALDLSPEELAQLPPDELLQVCLEYRQMLLTIRGILNTPNVTLTLRLVAMDLVYRLAQHQRPDQVLGGDEQVVYIKQVNDPTRRTRGLVGTAQRWRSGKPDSLSSPSS